MPHPRLPLIVVLFAQLVIPLAISGTAVALADVGADLGSNPGPLQWVVNGFNVSFAVCTVVWGAISDRIGYTRSFRIGVAISVVAGIGSVLAPTMALLDAARIVAGIGAAAVLTGGAPILTRLYSGADRAKAFTLFGAVNGLGLAVGPALSGLILSVTGWRGIFLVHTAVLVVALAGTVRLPNIPRGTTSLRQTLDFTALRSRRFFAMALVPVAGACGFVAFLTYLPSAVVAIHGLSAGAVGLLMLGMTVPVVVAPMLVHRVIISGRASSTAIVLTSFLCLVLGGVGVIVLLAPGLPIGAVVVPMLLLGLGFGLPLGFVDAEALAAVPADRAGAASGVVNLFRIGAEAVFVAVYAAILTAVVTTSLPGSKGDAVAAGGTQAPEVYHDGLTAAAASMLGIVVVCAAAFVWLTRARRAESELDADSDVAGHVRRVAEATCAE